MRLAQESKSVMVILVTKQRDTREKITENGKQVDNPRYNKFYRETTESIEVFDTTPLNVLGKPTYHDVVFIGRAKKEWGINTWLISQNI